MEIGSAHQEEINFLKESVESWKDVPKSHISFSCLSGLSNVVYKVTADADVSPKNLILRRFGNNEAVVDKEKELLVFDMMSRTGRGPKCYGHNIKFRSEEYFDATAIQTTQINEPYWRRKLAVSLAKFHSVDASMIGKDHIILDRLRNTKFYEAYNEKCLKKDGFTAKQFEKLSKLKFLGSLEEREYIKSITPLKNLVFSHNDTLNGNILVTAKERRIIIIDYEYSGYNSRAFDAANMFVESMMSYNNPNPPYFEIDSKVFPTLEEVKDFARYYLYASLFCDEDIECIEAEDDKFNNDSWLMEKIDKELNKEDFQREMNEYLDEFQKCCLLSQYYWATWGVLMCKAKSDPKSFDYLLFSYEKVKFYLKWKKQLEVSNSIFE